MKKALTKIIAAVLAAAAMLSPMSSNAVSHVVRENDDALEIVESRMKTYLRVENVHFFDWATSNGTTMPGYEYVYVNENGNWFMTFRRIDGIDVAIKLAEGVEREDVEKALHDKFFKNYNDVSFRLMNDHQIDTDRYYIDRYSTYPMSKAVKWLDFLKEQDLIISGKIYTEKYAMYEFYGSSVNCYGYSEENYEQISSFVENELEGYSVEVCVQDEDDYKWYLSSKYINVVPPENATLAEQIEAAEMIYEATGVAPAYESPSIASRASNGCIDVFNAVKGDANCDGMTTVADAVAILQSIGNNDKYPLSRQGSFNGDMVGDYDGITAADALAIQQLDAQSGI